MTVCSTRHLNKTLIILSETNGVIPVGFFHLAHLKRNIDKSGVQMISVLLTTRDVAPCDRPASSNRKVPGNIFGKLRRRRKNLMPLSTPSATFTHGIAVISPVVVFLIEASNERPGNALIGTSHRTIAKTSDPLGRGPPIRGTRFSACGKFRASSSLVSGLLFPPDK